MANVDIKFDDSQDISVWLKEIEDECGNVGIEVMGELGDYTKKVAEEELLAIKRTAPLYGKRTKHLHEDVIKRKYDKGRTVLVQGGKETKTLWHIVDDGTYRTRPHHFIPRVLNKVDKKAKELMDKQKGKLGD